MIFTVMNTSWAVVTKKAETNLGLYQCSALPTELTSQLGAGHFVAMYLFSDRSHLMSRYCYSKNKNKNMFLPHVDACYDLLI